MDKKDTANKVPIYKLTTKKEVLDYYKKWAANNQFNKDDKFQIITRHETSELNIPDSYLGIKYTQGLIIIQISLNKGRSIELKKKLYKRIADDLNSKLKIRKEDVFIGLIEVDKENWSFGNGEAQYASK